MEKLTKKEILQKEKFDEIYKKLITGDYILLGKFKEITTDEDIAYAGHIFEYKDDNIFSKSFGKSYFHWQHYGSSNCDKTKKGLKWAITEIFDDCNYFAIMGNHEYHTAVDRYYTEQWEIKNKQLQEA